MILRTVTEMEKKKIKTFYGISNSLMCDYRRNKYSLSIVVYEM